MPLSSMKRMYKNLGGVPRVFFIPSNVFLMVIVPLFLAVAFLSFVDWMFTVIGLIPLLALYVYTMILTSKKGDYFLSKMIHDYTNTFWVIKRKGKESVWDFNGTGKK